MSCSDIFLGIIAIVFPPIAVCFKRGCCTADVCINIALCMLGYIPGLLHAWYIIAKFPEHDYDYEILESAEGGRAQRVTYYYVNHESGNTTTGGRRTGGGQHQQQQQTYGTARTAPRVPGNSKPAPSHQQSGVAGSSSTAAGPAVGAGSDESGAPPSYSDVVRGDNKIQSQS